MNSSISIIVFLFVFLLLIAIPLLINIMLALMFKNIAKQKGHYEARYFWIPFFFGIVGYIMVAALPDRGVQNFVQVQPVVPAPVAYSAPEHITYSGNNNQNA